MMVSDLAADMLQEVYMCSWVRKNREKLEVQDCSMGHSPRLLYSKYWWTLIEL